MHDFTNPIACEILEIEGGLTKREQIATQLLAAKIIADATLYTHSRTCGKDKDMVIDAIALADELLEKLSQSAK